MSAHTFERYQQRNSVIHHIDPRVKVVAAVLFIIANVLLPDGSWLAFIGGFVIVMALAYLSRLGAWFVIKRSFVALPFALAAISIMFTIPGEALTTFSIGSWTFSITDAGLLRFVSIMIRSWLSVQMAILLTAVTTFPDLMHALRHLKVPQPLITIISFMYRYLFVLADEVMRLLRAREARSASIPGYKSGGSIVWRAKVVGNMAGQLFLRSYERSDRVYKAMLARGYRGHMFTMRPHIMQTHDWLALLIMLFLLFIMQLLAYIGA